MTDHDSSNQLGGGPASDAGDDFGSRLRLLYVANPASIHVQRWARFFASRGHEVHVAGLWNRQESDRSPPYAVHRLGRPFKAALALRRLARSLQPDLIHAHYLTHYGWIAWASGVRPLALTLWGSDVLIDARASWIRRVWARMALAGAALVTADSQEVIACAIRLGARPARVREIQFGVDTARFHPGMAPRELTERFGIAGRRVVFAPRSITPLYRMLTLLEAVSDMDDVVLVGTLAGADHAHVEEVRRAARLRHMEGRLVLVPSIPHEDMDSFYRLADVVASIPSSDGMPVSILEAFASGIPVVATDVPSVRPWLEDLRPDFLVPVDDPVATSRAIRSALDLTAPARADLASRERQMALEHGDETVHMLMVEAAYRQLVDR